MDLLSSLGLGNALPEQSTRITSHPGIVKALDSSGAEDVRLGFNACLHCGSNLDNDEDGAPKKKVKKSCSKEAKPGIKIVSCKGCKRVKYCSTSCRKADSEEQDDEDGEPSACGHSPVICTLLNLCNDDDDAEEDFYNEQTTTKNNKGQMNANNKISNDPKKEAAKYRVQTEFESYPATLFNILSEGPDWYMEAITQRLRSPEMKKQRRGKRDRASISPSKQQSEEESRPKRELVLHIVGASVDSELWYWNGTSDNDPSPVLNAYAEASTNLTSHLQSSLDIPSVSIRCVFVGPDCPPNTNASSVKVPVPDSKSIVTFETHRCNYGDDDDNLSNAPPDAIVFFNPGFSCTDYDWSKALANAAKSSTPFLITTNTEMEGFADIKCLLDGGYVDAKTLPGDILEAVDHDNGNGNHDGDDYDGSRCKFFLGENPYAGLRVRQSGTMGNDLYVKNRWIMGGIFHSATTSKKRTNSSAKNSDDEHDSSSEEGKKEKKKSNKRHGGGGERANEKKKSKRKSNPALI